MAAILQKAQRDIMYKAMDAIQERNDQIMKLLENGRVIFEQAMGARVSEIYAMRQKLWMKMDENRKSIDTLWNIVKTECEKY